MIISNCAGQPFAASTSGVTVNVSLVNIFGSHPLHNFVKIFFAIRLLPDCNSIIYDAVNTTEFTETTTNSEYENTIINSVILKIKQYIYDTKPSNSVFITFDGVAPVAKMEQQRTRRYKSQYMSNNNANGSTKKWNTSAITPGTTFMELLCKRLKLEFISSEYKYNIQNIYISCADESGEGEHKIVEKIRSGNYINDNISIYGLDSDLIMISIFHLDYCKNIYVFREAPEFIKSSIPSVIITDVSDLYFLDILMLSNSILKEMQCKFPDKTRIYDYVFLCFLLGNDFLPHFPAMNIRTHGIQSLLDIYRLHIGSHPNRSFISNMKIQWKNVGIFINEIAKCEHQLLVSEYSVRDKMDYWHWGTKEYDELLLKKYVKI